MKTKFLLSTLSTISAVALLSGCGSSSSDATTPSSTTTTQITGQLVDSYVENADYTCADGSSGVTDVNGTFKCKTLPVQFKLGGLKLGEVATLPSDAQVFPQDLLGVARDDVNNTKVRAMARFLQSCDDDNISGNGLKIRQEIKERILNPIEFNPDDLASYESDYNITLVDEDKALEHITQTTNFVDALNSVTNLPANVKEALLTSQSTLTQELKNTLSYMGNEERLAHDLYLKLYETYPFKQLTNVATKSETTHIQTVQLLVKKYITDVSEFTNIDLSELNYKDSNLSNMTPGVYDIKAIQDLYDSLLAKGQSSPEAALEVGCMVEVTDINDLAGDIQTAKDANATDIQTAFEFLRDGSYNHYWAFDGALKAQGVSEGCCVLGDAYCHNEYPKNESMKGSH